MAQPEPRLQALYSYEVLDTPPEPEFDDIVQIARTLCRAPVALISLVDAERQWFKARAGFDLPETPLDQSVCAHALSEDRILVIGDLTKDARTADNALVTGPPHMRFYAGAVLRSLSGRALGTLCVLDDKPRPQGLEHDQCEALVALARQVMHHLETRRALGRREEVLSRARSSGRQHRSRALASEAAQAQLEAAEAGLREAQAAGRIGTFSYRLGQDLMTVSPEMCRLFGVPERETYPIDSLTALVIEEDRALASTPDSRADGSAIPDVELRIRRADTGEIRWISRRSAFERDDHGRVLRMAGTVQDITPQREADRQKEALIDLSDALGDVTSVEAAIAAACEVAVEVLAVSRAGYADIDVTARLFTVVADQTDGTVRSLSGQYRFEVIPATIQPLLAGAPLVIPDIAAANWMGREATPYRVMEAAAQVIIPLQTHGELSGALFLQNSTPREWTDREMGFAAAVAEKLHASVARLQAQADQKLLNDELSHRLKNTLAVVQAISAQTLGGRADPEALDAFGSRLEALSKAHDVLLQQNWSAARIAALVSEVLGSLNAAERVDVRGVDINLGSRAVLSLAMLLHELTTNAMKHGALSNADGRVALSWRIEGLGPEAVFNLGWRESGGPPVREPERLGFGSRLIRAGLSGTAATQIAYLPSGFSADFRAPLSFVTEA